MIRIKSKKPTDIAEYEAERWAQKKMRGAGIAVPMLLIQDSNRYVAAQTNQHLRKQQWGLDQQGVRFAGKEWRRPMMVDCMMTIPESNLAFWKAIGKSNCIKIALN